MHIRNLNALETEARTHGFDDYADLFKDTASIFTRLNNVPDTVKKVVNELPPEVSRFLLVFEARLMEMSSRNWCREYICYGHVYYGGLE